MKLNRGDYMPKISAKNKKETDGMKFEKKNVRVGSRGIDKQMKLNSEYFKSSKWTNVGFFFLHNGIVKNEIKYKE